MIAYLFPGQGSQIRGMGADLFPLFKEYVAEADALLGYSVEALCTEDHSKLNQTQFTQPAIYVVNALIYLNTLKKSSQKPDYVAGHSLGEYNALFAANVFDFITGLSLVQKRGELMSQATGGGMAAVIGLKQEDIAKTLQENKLATITVANYNAYEQFVLSGPQTDIESAKVAFTKCNKATFIPLTVSGAFHSSYMLTAQQAFATFIEPFEFSIPTMPVIANINATPYHPAVMKHNLIQQITHPVEWVKTINYLNNQPHITFEEMGSGKVLTGLLQRINNNK